MGADTRSRIISEAEKLFSHQGYSGTSLASIADEVGLRPPALYRHFNNKKAIYEAVLDELFEPFMEMVESLANAQQPVDVADFLGPIVNRYREVPSIAPIILQATLSGGDQLEYLTRRWFVPFFALVQRVLPKDSPLATNSAIANFHSFMLGYIALAPFHGQVFSYDPLGDNELGEHYAILERMAEVLAEIN